MLLSNMFHGEQFNTHLDNTHRMIPTRTIPNGQYPPQDNTLRNVPTHEKNNVQVSICFMHFPAENSYLIPDAVYQLEENLDIPDIPYTRSLGVSEDWEQSCKFVFGNFQLSVICKHVSSLLGHFQFMFKNAPLSGPGSFSQLGTFSRGTDILRNSSSSAIDISWLEIISRYLKH